MKSHVFSRKFPLKIAHGVMRVLVIGIVPLLFVSRLAEAIEVPGCGRVGEGFHADYRLAKSESNSAAAIGNRRSLKTVEDAHFDARVESLMSGRSTTRPGPDLSYTLERVPNHYRALIAMMALGEREKTDRPAQTAYPLECWFRRATAIFPDENTVRMLYAQFLYKSARDREAEQQLGAASSDASDNPFTLHNIGMVYFDAKNYEQALLHAHKAYALGLTNLTLRARLESVGKWSELAAAPPIEPGKSP